MTCPSASILIPCYNGGTFLRGVLEGLKPLGLPVLVVDDGSSDGSGDTARRLGARVLTQPRRSGKGAAMRRGIAELLGACSPDWIIFMDSDGQHLPCEVERFLASMDDGVDLLLGSRMEERGNFPGYRLVTNRAGTEVLRWMSGHRVPDTQCGFRAATTSLLRRLTLESAGFEIETEILLKALRRGARWRTVPVSAVYDSQGSHFVPVHDTFRICMAALRFVQG